MREFQDTPAVRSQTPLLLGLVGPSGTGKTFSALRLATGIQRVSGGEIFFIDTEANRALHYADKFQFRHIKFVAPFGSLDYLSAIQHCVSKGAKVIVIDSMSHEHEGPGGVLEQHEAELDRLAGQDYGRRKAMTFLAWAKPKAARRRFINSLLQLPVHVLCCFRAKTKLKIVRGQEPESRGYQPIAGEEFIYEMTAKFCLLPGANGFPSWQSEHADEQAMMKLPEQFRDLAQGRIQLSEDVGQKLAEWAAGGTAKSPIAELLAAYGACQTADSLDAAEKVRAALWTTLGKPDQAKLKTASEAAKKRLAEMPPAEPPPEDRGDSWEPPDPALDGTLPGMAPATMPPH